MKWLVFATAIVAPLFFKGPPAVLPPTPPISRAQDRVAANPRANVVEIDNQWVRTIRMKLAPQEMSGLHTHPDTVAVMLTDARIRVFTEKGSTQTITHAAGDVAFQPGSAQPHSEQNVSDRPLEIVFVELKPGSTGGSAPVTLDPVKLDPDNHPVVFENERVRAIRTILPSRLKSPMHEHPHYVVVYLTELHTTMTMADGKKIDNPRKPGDVAWRDALKHETEHMGPKTAVEIQIELK
jgi:quercetin dioxygenase-like cupin family protein